MKALAILPSTAFGPWKAVCRQTFCGHIEGRIARVTFGDF